MPDRPPEPIVFHSLHECAAFVEALNRELALFVASGEGWARDLQRFNRAMFWWRVARAVGLWRDRLPPWMPRA